MAIPKEVTEAVSALFASTSSVLVVVQLLEGLISDTQALVGELYSFLAVYLSQHLEADADEDSWEHTSHTSANHCHCDDP